MTSLFILIPLAVCMGLVALGAFVWCLGSGQYEDLEGAAERVLLDRDDDRPGAPRAEIKHAASTTKEAAS
ncbi:MAG: cbb3-type cytochrome oxidase assembly protein CcoS [Paracoccaceae bacterium]